MLFQPQTVRSAATANIPTHGDDRSMTTSDCQRSVRVAERRDGWGNQRQTIAAFAFPPAGRHNRRVMLSDVEVDGRRVDVEIGGRDVRDHASRGDVAGTGGALFSGLHDHHLHLRVTAAALRSLDVGGACDANSLRDLLATAALVDGWVRAVNYDEAVAGRLDRWSLDALRGDVPVRAQPPQQRAVERELRRSRRARPRRCGPSGDRPRQRRTATRAALAGGRVAVACLEQRQSHRSRPTCARSAAASRPVGSPTSPTRRQRCPRRPPLCLPRAHDSGELPQRVMLLAAHLATALAPLTLGPVKIVIADHALPSV